MSGARRLWAALLLAVAANASALAPPPAQRVASLNLCTDLLLLAVAAPEHIVSLTALAADPEARYSMEELSIADAFDSLPEDMKRRLAERAERHDGNDVADVNDGVGE